MSAILTQVAEGLTAKINAATWSPTLTAVRSWGQWDDKLEDLNQLHCDVLGQAHMKTALASRRELEYLVAVDVALRKRFPPPITTAHVDQLVALLEGLSEWSIGIRLDTFSDAVWEATDILLSSSRALLRSNRQYSGFFRVQFRVPKVLP